MFHILYDLNSTPVRRSGLPKGSGVQIEHVLPIRIEPPNLCNRFGSIGHFGEHWELSLPTFCDGDVEPGDPGDLMSNLRHVDCSGIVDWAWKEFGADVMILGQLSEHVFLHVCTFGIWVFPCLA